MQGFRVGVTGDFLKPNGAPGFGAIGLELLDQAGIGWEFFATPDREVPPEACAQYDGLLVLGARVTASSFSSSPRTRIVARFGVGYDSVDVPACTAAGALLTITPDGVRRPVAIASLTFVLALSHKLLLKDRLTRAGRWADKLDYHGQGLTGRTLGIVGFGNIGQELASLATPLGLHVLACDPFPKLSAANRLKVRLTSLDELLAESDFVCICCALTPETHRLIDGRRLGLMKRSAYFINVARGPIVDQQALTTALQLGQIAGAGLDVFEKEPIDPADPLLALENVILAPHALCWTDECFRLIGENAIGSLVDVARGILPKHIVNREALAHPRLANLRPRGEDETPRT